MICCFFTGNVKALVFDDPNFQKCVVDELNSKQVNDISNRGYDTDISKDELASITYLNCSGDNKISDGMELKYFPNLETLKLSNHNISKIDVKNNKLLTSLDLSNNRISSIDLSNNVKLVSLNLDNNSLTKINISHNSLLEKMEINDNNLVTLDTLNNSKLKYLGLSNNKLTSVNFSKNLELTNLYIDNNKLRTLNLSNNNKLKEAKIYGNLYSTDSISLKQNATLKLKNYVIMPKDIKATEEWYSTDSSIATFNKWNLRAIMGGKTDIRYTYKAVDADIYYQFDGVANVISVSNNNYLKELSFSSGQIEFDKNTNRYDMSVENSVTDLVVRAISDDRKSKVEILGNNDLVVGDNLVTIKVTAENGKVRNYFVNVRRISKDSKLSSNSYLKNIEIKKYRLKFDSKVYEYKLKIKKGDKRLDIKTTAFDDKTIVVVLDNNNLETGSVVKIKATAEDGTTSTYVIEIEAISSVWIWIFAIGVIGIIGSIIAYIVLKRKNKISTN